MDLSFLKEDAKTPDKLSESTLERLQRLVRLYMEQHTAVLEAEQALDAAKKAFNKTSMEDIPEVLLGAGLSQLKLADGKKVTVKEEISCSVKDMPSFSSFVTDRGDDEILKTTVALGRVPDNILAGIKRLLAERFDLYPEVVQTVHNATLKKYLKEISGVGLEDPEERLGERYVPMHELPPSVSVYRYYKTTIK